MSKSLFPRVGDPRVVEKRSRKVKLVIDSKAFLHTAMSTVRDASVSVNRDLFSPIDMSKVMLHEIWRSLSFCKIKNVVSVLQEATLGSNMLR